MTRLIDVHRHLWDVGWFPEAHLRRVARMTAGRRDKNADQVLERIKTAKTMEPTGAGALAEMEHYGIDVSVILALDYGMAYGEDSPTPVEEFNRLTIDVARKHPGRLLAMCGFDPRRPNAPAMFEKAVKEWGAVGLKVYPPNGFSPDEDFCYPMYRKAIELDVPILVHTGGREPERAGWPSALAKVAKDLPDLRIIMGHVNQQDHISSGKWKDGIAAAEPYPNIVLDICDWQVQGFMEEEHLPEFYKVIRELLDRAGPDRIVWGTDLPQTDVNSRGRQATETWVDAVKNLPERGAQHGVTFTAEERDGICYKAAEKVLGNAFGK
jgi:predicted TIM-barrel fold metal-dependent hydrolase